MTQENTPKQYPVSTAEVAKMLGIQNVSQNLPMGTFASGSDLPVADLPVASPATVIDTGVPADSKPQTHTSDAENVLPGKASQPAYLKAAKAIVPYVAIFTIGLFLYYFFFSSLNLNLNLNQS